jgi:hypothetical protein
MRWIPFFGLLAGCGPDLPAGWEDATPVDALTQSACDGTPYEDFDERVESDLTGDPLSVDVFETPFRCAQEVEAFWKRDGDRIEVLVQPIDMNPRVVAGCDCLYDLSITVTETGEPSTALEVWRRWDALNDPNEPVSIGSIALGPEGPVSP